MEGLGRVVEEYVTALQVRSLVRLAYRVPEIGTDRGEGHRWSKAAQGGGGGGGCDGERAGKSSWRAVSSGTGPEKCLERELCGTDHGALGAAGGRGGGRGGGDGGPEALYWALVQQGVDLENGDAAVGVGWGVGAVVVM